MVFTYLPTNKIFKLTKYLKRLALYVKSLKPTLGWDVKVMGKNTIRILKRKDFGSIGIGAMIVFIAMVLVAGIAASVLITTSSRLEMQALNTGQETIAEVGSGLKVECVEGYNSSGAITKLAVEVAPRAGSPDLDLGQTIVEISDSDNKFILRYGNSRATAASVNGDVFGVSNFGSATDFDLIVMQDADSSVGQTTPVMNFGDHVIIAIDASAVFSSNSGINPRADVSGMVVVEEGAPGIIGFTTPSSYSETVMELQ